MAILAPELSIGALTALLCVIIVMLIPLTIWALWTCDRQKPTGGPGTRRSQSGRGPTTAGSGKR